MQQRLQKAIAAAGIASRRHAEELIAAGRVRVNGEIVREMGMLVDTATQKITVDGRPLMADVERRYIALNKPLGYVSTVWDPYVTKKVTDLVDIPGARLVPAGRLDADSEGLILLSNDGDFVYKVTHPSQSMGKTYLATVEGFPQKKTVQKLARGPDARRGGTPDRARRSEVCGSRAEPEHVHYRTHSARGPEPTGAPDDGAGRASRYSVGPGARRSRSLSAIYSRANGAT